MRTTGSAGRRKNALTAYIVVLLIAAFGASMLGLVHSAGATSPNAGTSTSGGVSVPVVTAVIGATATATVTTTPQPIPANPAIAQATATATPQAAPVKPAISQTKCLTLWLANSKKLDLKSCNMQLVVSPTFKPVYPLGLQFLVGASRNGKGILNGDLISIAMAKGYTDGRFNVVVTHPNGTESKAPFSPPIGAKMPVSVGCWQLQVQVAHKVTKNHKVQTTVVFQNIKPNNMITQSGIYRWVKVVCSDHK